MDITPSTVWAALGFLLLIFEIFTLSFVVVFFGVAALVVALIKYTTGLDNITAELLIFAGVGGSCLFFFRNKLRKTFNKRGGIANDASTVIELTAAVPPQKTGKIEYQGTVWDAFNESDRPLAVGDKAVIVRTEGIKLIVRPWQKQS